MKYTKEEQEIIKLIVQNEGKGLSIAQVLNYSRFLEKRGVAIIDVNGSQIICSRKDIYPDYFDSRSSVYLVNLLALIDRLHGKGCLKFCNQSFQRPLVIGVQNSQWAKRDVITTDYRDTIVLAGHHKAWYGADNKEKYWMLEIWDAAKLNIPNYIYSEYIVSQDLKDLVKNKFKSDEQRRFAKLQLATWISIAVAIILGILGIIF